MTRFTFALFLMLVALVATASAFASGDDIMGTWFDQSHDTKIEIFKSGNTYCGKIAWMKKPVYPASSTDGAPGTPKLDTKNPDAARRKTPVLGMQIIEGFIFGDNQWYGKIYDPASGKTYSAQATLASPNQLELREFLGISLQGRTVKWTRAK
jgi:uncharacterized protein (DUF2147 family)